MRQNEVNNDRKKKDVDNIDISDSMSLALRHGSEDSIMLQQLDSDYEKRKSDSRRKKRRNSGFIDSIEETFAKDYRKILPRISIESGLSEFRDDCGGWIVRFVRQG